MGDKQQLLTPSSSILSDKVTPAGSFSAIMDAILVVLLSPSCLPFMECADLQPDPECVQTEQVMMGSLHTITRKSVTDYVTSKRSDWLLKWPGQVVLSVSQIFWTKAVDDALRSAGTEGLQKFAHECSDTLKSEVELVRGELTKLQRATLGAQVVIDVHARDVLAEMARDGVCSETDFAWQAQLRFVIWPCLPTMHGSVTSRSHDMRTVQTLGR